ncbi:MAG: phosphatidate cytidylyltransferase [Rikenellaceae bacterium]
MKIDKNFVVRSISGIILVVMLVGGVLYSHLTCFILLSLLATATVYELLSILEKSLDIKPIKWLAVVTALIVSVVVFLVGSESYLVRTNVILSLTAILLIARLSLEVFRIKIISITDLTYELFALLYILFPFMLLTQIEGRFIVALFSLVWGNDVGAYVFGVSFGKHKLCERLSPKKSWEGYIGGLISSIAIALIAALVFEQSLLSWAFVGLIISNAAVVGDLFESMIKRSLNIKDSGHIIPGHGGLLDRFDAMLFAAPIFYVLYIYILS